MNDATKPSGRVLSGDAPKRTKSAALDALLGVKRRVSPDGWIRVIDYMGDDAAVVQAARISYGSGTKGVGSDAALIRYLMRNRHTSPFEMCELKLHIRIPIFVARQWIRHRTASVNEISGRYTVLTESAYLPSADDLAPQSKSNKQGREAGAGISRKAAEAAISKMKSHNAGAFKLYRELLEDDEGRPGIARELARIPLPLATMTEMYWKIDLHNLLHFLSLRLHPSSQKEIGAYAREIAELVKIWCPETYRAFEDYVLDGARLSASSIRAVAASIDRGRLVKPDDATDGEWRELLEVLDVEGARRDYR